MTIKIPGEIGYKQTNRSDKLGSLWSTMGIDLQSNLGVLRVSPRLRINSQVSDLANLGVPVGFKYYSGAFRTVAGARFFTGGATPNAAFTQDATASTPTTCSTDVSDLELFNGKVYVTTDTTLISNGSTGTFGAWSATLDTLSSSVPHILRYFSKFNRLYITNGTSIRSIDTANLVASAGDYFINTTFGQVILSLGTSLSFVWAGVTNKEVGGAGGGGVVKWDGISNTSITYPVDARAVFAIATNPANDLTFAMDSNGALLRFNGSGFVEVGRLPFTKQLPYNPDGLVLNRFIHPNGLVFTKNGTVLAFINNLNNDSGATIEENIPSGVWEWSESNGFVHKSSLTYNIVGNSTITDYGQNRISRAGGMANVNFPNTTAGRFGTIMLGAAIYTDASSTTNAILIDDSLDAIQKYGYIVTTKIFSKDIDSIWNKFYVRHKLLLDSSDSITAKYRVSEATSTEITITWTSSSTFTTTTDVSALVGYEVEVIQGKGSGKTAHISSVTGSGTYTVTLDDTFTGATSGTAKARIQNWTKIGTQTNQSLSFFNSSVDKTSTWIQLKVCMQFKGTDEVDDSVITSKVNHKIE